MQWLGGLLEQAAPGLLSKITSTPSSQPTGFQRPDSTNEIIFSPEKPVGHAKVSNPTSDGSQFSQRRQNTDEEVACRVASFATDVDGGYTGDEDHPHRFGAAFAGRDGSFPRESFSPQRPADSPIAVQMDAAGLETAPNGIGYFRGMGHSNDNAEDLYASYHRGNGNVEGPFEDVPPTTPCLDHITPPPMQYAAVPSDAFSARCGEPSGAYDGSPSSPSRSTAAHGYSPPSTAGAYGQAPRSPSYPSTHGNQGGGPTTHPGCREAWEPGSIVEVYSSSAGSWNVARVINVAHGNQDEILTVQFMAYDGPKQKSLSRGDQHIVPLGSRGGSPELPPGFQMRESQSRPGQQVFLDATTGVKYASLELSWSVHFERLASNNTGGLEKTVAAGSQLQRLHQQASASVPGPAASPMGTCAGSFSHSFNGFPAPQVPQAPQVPVHSHVMTEGALVASCRSDGPPAISLAELMKMKDHSDALPLAPPSALSGGWGAAPDSPLSHGFPLQTPSVAHPPATAALGMSGPLPSIGAEAGGPMPSAAGKIALPSFGERPPTDSQAAYLHHLADAGIAEAASAPFSADRCGMAPQAMQGADPYTNMHGFATGQTPSVPRRQPQVRSSCPELDAWKDDPFSQWRSR